MSRVLRLPGRYHRTIPLDSSGYEDTGVELAADKTALVVLHCWNIGCGDGPEVDPRFWVGMGFREDFVEAERIMREVIRPCMDAARAAGVLVAHVEAESIAAKHAEAQEGAEAPCASGGATAEVVPGWRAQIVARSHGADYPTQSPYARMDRARIVSPLPGEPFAYQTGQFHRLLQQRGIENLIYTGFATDMCVLRAPGGIEPMAGYGYRLYLMRDATLGIELPSAFDERIATRWAIAYFETHYGDTLLSGDFLAACRGL
jgi:nicotinamidase-related amidase